MAIAFSDVAGGLGIVQQTRNFMRVDATQWPTVRIVNSVNNYLDTITGYAIGADRRFQWDDTNHTMLPIGTTNLVANQSDYSFLTDQQGNNIINLTRIDVLDSNNVWRELRVIDQANIPMALDEFNKTSGLPIYYDKIADNIIRLYPKPIASVTAGIKFYFQRTASYFTSLDTVKSPGVSPLLHRGFVITAAYDGALTLGLSNLNGLNAEKMIEEQKMIEYFKNDRNTDEVKIITPIYRSSR